MPGDGAEGLGRGNELGPVGVEELNLALDAWASCPIALSFKIVNFLLRRLRALLIAFDLSLRSWPLGIALLMQTRSPITHHWGGGRFRRRRFGQLGHVSGESLGSTVEDRRSLNFVDVTPGQPFRDLRIQHLEANVGPRR